MYEYTIKPTIEPNDQYQKAKKALLDAMNEVNQLSQEQQYQLMQEIIPPAILCQLLNKLSQ